MEFILKKFTENDFVHYFELVNDEKVMEMITERAIALDEALDNFKDLINNNKINEHFGNFKIINTKTNDFLGLAKLEIKSEDDRETELGYMILPKYWGNGIASKVCKLLLSSAKKHKHIDKVFAIIDPQNLPSRRILINNSFTSKEFKDFDGLPGEILELKLK